MKYLAKVSGKKKEWTPASSEFQKEWSFEKRAGGWVIAKRIVNGVEERIRFFYAKQKQHFWAKVNGLDVYGEKTPVTREGSGESGASDFTAQFHGKIRKVMVAAGQKVEAGTPLLMIEAMKMEFAVKAQNAGTVKAILVAEGQQLTPGQKLLDFEDQKSEAKK
jgi:biotin carboxyl carrier protein